MPSWHECESFLAYAGIYALLALSLNWICGVAGVLQLGQAGFFALGAYAAALVSFYAATPALGGGNLMIGLAAGAGAATLFAALVGLPCLRLRGDYLAIATLALGEIVRIGLGVLRFPGGPLVDGETIGGPGGIRWPDAIDQPGWEGYDAAYANWIVIWLAVVVVGLLLRNLKASAVGRALLCIREDEIAARAMGVEVPSAKLRALLLSAALAGVAGALYWHHKLMVEPRDASLLLGIQILLMVVLGGLGSLGGAVLAAVLLTALPEVLCRLPFGEGGLGAYRELLFALLLILLIRWRPDGLLVRRFRAEDRP